MAARDRIGGLVSPRVSRRISNRIGDPAVSRPAACAGQLVGTSGNEDASLTSEVIVLITGGINVIP
jgi:hypothetical protein